MATDRLTIWLNGQDVSDDIALTNRRGTPFGYAAATLEHRWVEWIGGARVPECREIGAVVCGNVTLTNDARALGYAFEILEEP